MNVEQKFASHLVPDHDKVRQATSEFKDFAIIWWQECASLNIQPDSWDALKIAMRDRFVPASYKRDLRKKLQRLEQGDMSVQDYYDELQKGMIHCGVVKDPEDKVGHFYAGLKREIQDIVDYKPFTTTNQLFQLAILVEKELQGRQQQFQRNKNTFMPRTFTPPAARTSSAAPSASKRSPSTTTPSDGKPHLQDQSKGVPSSRCSSSFSIQCHRC
jgi:hypothetical protein